jgi:PAS domain S-box-containing protein
MTSVTTAEIQLNDVLEALSNDPSEDDWAAVLDRVAAPTYVTDPDGNVTYWNQACVEFAGREPELGQDRWCVTWKLYTTDGDPLPHDACPMAVAIKQQRAVRGAVAIAERPDGTRRAFTPYPTPLFDAAGGLKGAVNMLIDVTAEQDRALRTQAERCRRLAKSVTDGRASRVLDDMAIGYERSAASLAQG